jgi:hypothetical protein
LDPVRADLRRIRKGRYGDHERGARSAALAQVLQDLAALRSGQIDVKNNQGGRGSRIVAVRFVEKPDSLLSTFYDAEVGMDIHRVDPG